MAVQHIERGLSLKPGVRVRIDGQPARAAVALVFRPGGELLFIRRSEREGDPWSGHMAFPGGRKDPGDRDELDTAVRETWEEVGLDLRHPEVRLLGMLDEAASPRLILKPRLVITPYVFVDPRPPMLKPNHEVAGTYWFSLQRFLQDEGRGSMTLPWRGEKVRFPVVHLDGAQIWGLTLGILDTLLERVRSQDNEGATATLP